MQSEQRRTAHGESANMNPIFYPLTVEQQHELAQLGLRISDFECFLHCFVGHRFDYIVRGRTDRTWRSVGQCLLTNGNLLSHLAGQRWLGTGCRWDSSLGTSGRHVTPYVVIDLDFAGDMEEMVRRSGEMGRVESAEWQDLLQGYDRV